MKSKFASLTLIALLGTAAASAFALNDAEVERSISLNNDSTVYIFKDGKMAMEDQYGNVVSMEKDAVMETKDGRKIKMHGNEVWRLDDVFHRDHRGG